MKTKSRRQSLFDAVIAIVAAASVFSQQPAHAATFYWDANGASTAAVAATGTWGTSTFWSTDPTGGTATSAQTIDNTSDVVFAAGSNSTGGTVTISTTQSAHSITFDDPVAFTLSGGTAINLGSATAGSGIFDTANSASTISTGLILNSAATAIAFSNSGTSLLTIGAVTGAAAGTQTITVGSSSSGSITLNGIIGNGGGGGNVAVAVNNTSTGITVLGGVNTYTGGTTVSAGILQLTNVGTTGGTNSGTFSLGGGTLQINQASNNFGYNPTITLTADSTISSIGAGSINMTGTINGGNHVLNASSGATRLYLNGTINNVTQINITAGAVGLDLASANHESTPVVVSSGASLFVANQANTLTSNITLNGGTGFGGTGALALEGGTNQTPILSGTLTLNSGNSSIGNAGTASATNNISITGLVTGTGSLTKISINKLSLSNAASDYTGTTTVSAGTLNVGTFANVNTVSSLGKGSTGGSSADLILNGGTLQYTARRLRARTVSLVWAQAAAPSTLLAATMRMPSASLAPAPWASTARQAHAP